MMQTKLKPEQLLKLAGLPKSVTVAKAASYRDLMKLATWVSNNLVLLQDDCPECGQSDCEFCETCQGPECQCEEEAHESDL